MDEVQDDQIQAPPAVTVHGIALEGKRLADGDFPEEPPANPSALGILGIAFSLLLVAFHFLTVTHPINTTALVVCLLFGFATFVTGVLEFRGLSGVGSTTFSYVVFVGFGSMFMGFALIFILPAMWPDDVPAANAFSTGFYFFCWFLFSIFATVHAFIVETLLTLVHILFLSISIFLGWTSICFWVAGFAKEGAVAVTVMFAIAGVIGVIGGLVAFVLAAIRIFNANWQVADPDADEDEEEDSGPIPVLPEGFQFKNLFNVITGRDSDKVMDETDPELTDPDDYSEEDLDD